MNAIVAMDVGGANLKLARRDGECRTIPFQVWRRPRELAQAITGLLAQTASFQTVAVTMTAELCDCFETKSDGVRAVLDAVETAVHAIAPAAAIRVWLTRGTFVPVQQARAEPRDAAASNWLALAAWAGRLCPTGNALLIDVGSTTSDIIPLCNGVPVPQGRSDMDRLATGELVYSGVRRTPVFALAPLVQLAGRGLRLAAELFATTEDVYVWRGDLPPRAEAIDTADGRPATPACAAARLARAVCADRSMLADADIDQLVEQFHSAQLATLAVAARQVADRLGRRLRTVIVCGSGEFLARRVAERLGFDRSEWTSLGDRLGPAVSSAACAYALAVLAAETP